MLYCLPEESFLVQRSLVENVSTKKTQYHNCVVMSYAYIFKQKQKMQAVILCARWLVICHHVFLYIYGYQNLRRMKAQISKSSLFPFNFNFPVVKNPCKLSDPFSCFYYDATVIITFCGDLGFNFIKLITTLNPFLLHVLNSIYHANSKSSKVTCSFYFA